MVGLGAELKFRFFSFVLISLLFGRPVIACDNVPVQTQSPNGKISLFFCLQGEQPSYFIEVQGQKLIEPSALGFEIQNQPSLAKNFRITRTEPRTFDETWEQVWGEERWIRNHYNELKVTLVEKIEPLREMIVVFRVYDDGVGFRYEIPEQKNLKDFVITDEKTEFNFLEDYSTWSIPAYTTSVYEDLYKKTPISWLSAAHTPMTIEAGGLYVSIHEANLRDYSSMTLVKQGSGRLRCGLVPWSDGTKVKTHAPMVTPWRTLQISETAGGLITSYLILNLNEPNALKDTSWIHPQKFMGIWWGMHLRKFTWGSGPQHGATTAHAREYIDAASSLGIPGLLIEGWNIGWDGDWYKNGQFFNFTRAYPDFDLTAVAAYAHEKGVQLIGHHETGGAIHNYEAQVDDAFDLYQKNGVHIVKTGYVNEHIEGSEWHYGQLMARHHQLITEKAVQNEIMLDIHEPIKDTGLRRTFPNLMTREGGRGAEYDAWGGTNGNPPEHTTILPFTRMLSGPFDYTPGIFDLLKGATPDDRVRTTLAKQLALFVVIYSPLQMAADLPENYKDHPAFRFIHDVPTDWETTQVLNAKIGDYVTIVRKDRNSRDWYLGSITDEEARTFDMKLDFLEPGVSYCAEVYRDRADTDLWNNPTTYEIEKKNVTQGSPFTIRLARGGGQAVRFTATEECRVTARKKLRP